MTSRLCRLFILISLLVFAAAEINAQENFDAKQLSLITPEWNTGIFDVAVEGNYAYLAGSGDGFRIIDISDPESPVEIHPTANFDMLSYPRYIEASGDYLYLESNDRGIDIFNISNPERAYFVKHVRIAESRSRTMRNIAVEGDRLYVCRESSNNSLTMIDISDPSNAEVIASFGSYVNGFEVQGNQAYLNSYGYIFAFDISDPATPETLWAYCPEHRLNVTGLSVKGNYAYLAAAEEGLIVVDLTTLQEVARFEELAVAFGTQIVGNLLYVNYGNPDCPLAVIDIQTPSNPEILGIYYPPEDLADFVVLNDIAYVADYHHGLRLVDVSDSENPSEISFINEYADYYDIQADESGLRVLERNGMAFWDMRNPSAPQKSSYWEGYQYRNAQVNGTTAYFLDNGANYPAIDIVDLSEPSPPELIIRYETQGGFPMNFLVRDHFLFLEETNGLRLLDVSDPLNIVEMDYIEVESPKEIACGDHYVYLMNHSRQIMVIDYSNPAELEVAGLWNTDLNTGYLTVCNGLVYFASGTDILVFDSHDLSNPEPVTELDVQHDNYFVIGLDVIDNDVIVMMTDWLDNPSIVEVYDFANLDAPTLSGSFHTFSFVEKIAVSENLIYVMSSNDIVGVYQFDFTTPVDPVAHEIPANSFQLLSNYPNPFNSTTQIRFEVAGQHHVSLEVFDMLGRQVTTLANQDFSTGTHVIPWNGTNAAGSAVASGKYFITARANGSVSTIPIVLLK